MKTAQKRGKISRKSRQNERMIPYMNHRKSIHLLKAIYVCPAVIFFIWFVRNASSIASRHLDQQITYPALFLILGLALLLLHFCLKNVRQQAGTWYMIPAVYILSGLIALFIGYMTPCC